MKRGPFESAGCDPLQQCLEDLQKMQPLRLRQLVDVLTFLSAPLRPKADRSRGSAEVQLCAAAPAATIDETVSAELNQRQLIMDMARTQRSSVCEAFAAAHHILTEKLKDERRVREAVELERRHAMDLKYKQSLAHLRSARPGSTGIVQEPSGSNAVGVQDSS